MKCNVVVKGQDIRLVENEKVIYEEKADWQNLQAQLDKFIKMMNERKKANESKM